MRLQMSNTKAWSLPESWGLEVASALGMMRGIHLTAEAFRVLVFEVEGQPVTDIPRERAGVWMLTDNGGELNLYRVNDGRQDGLLISLPYSRVQYGVTPALTMVRWIYQWVKTGERPDFAARPERPVAESLDVELKLAQVREQERRVAWEAKVREEERQRIQKQIDGMRQNAARCFGPELAGLLGLEFTREKLRTNEPTPVARFAYAGREWLLEMSPSWSLWMVEGWRCYGLNVVWISDECDPDSMVGFQQENRDRLLVALASLAGPAAA